MKIDPVETPTKPCIALMGEFSAGKSTLANLMLDSSPLPVQVIATRLPPVQITFGTNPPYRLDRDGKKHAIDLADLSSVPLDDTSLIHIFRQDSVLEHCDLIDMPGISDPNMPSDSWEQALPKAHAVIWCTHATQAWRQSEAAVWAKVSSDIRARSLLLVTRIDKIIDQGDKLRVMKRVKKETEGLFNRALPISLTDAQAAGEDKKAWVSSGADAFASVFFELVAQLNAELQGEAFVPAPLPEIPAPTIEKIVPRRVRSLG